MTSFRTKRGRCIIDGDDLYLSSSMAGLFRRFWEGGRLGRLLAVSYLVFFAWFFYKLLFDLGTPFKVGIALGAALLALSYVTNSLRGFSRQRVIPLDSVKEVSFTEGRPGLTRPRFIVEFEKEGGEQKKRYIMMPSLWLDYSEEEVGKAKMMFEDKGLRAEY
ncbi:MAG: hypothetical protein ABEJ07_00510 [Candidatus Nanohaloarchaea archaeon]